MNSKEDFQMYAKFVDKPYIIPQNKVDDFLENSKRQKGIAEKLGSIFPKECFEFKQDENGYMVATIDVQSEN